jgi:glycosyltransferase involved in cell wall biosynthesis
MTENILRVCYFGTYREEYPRNQNMIEGLRRNGVQVTECHESLWKGIEDRVRAASGGWISPKFICRVIRSYFRLLKKYRSVGDYDILIVGYPAQFDVILGWILARLKGKPLCWDILMSIYLVAIERGLDKVSPITTKFLRIVENLACRLPDLLILESLEYMRWFCKTHQISEQRFNLVPMGVDELKYLPLEGYDISDDLFRIVYYGSFIRNHGVPVILEAAKLLSQEDNFQFELIGIGPELDRCKEWVANERLANIEFAGWLTDEDLHDHIAKACLCLGIFGDTPQSMMTIQHKILECLAFRKPVITGKSDLILRTFQHKQHLYICERSAESLADGIREIICDPALRERMAMGGYFFFKEHFSVGEIGRVFLECLEPLIKKSRKGRQNLL